MDDDHIKPSSSSSSTSFHPASAPTKSISNDPVGVQHFSGNIENDLMKSKSASTASTSKTRRQKASFWLQFHALSRKTWHYQRRQHCENFCSFIVPALIIILVALLNRVFTTDPEQPTTDELNPKGAFAPIPFPPTLCFDNYFAQQSGLCAQFPIQPYPNTSFLTGYNANNPFLKNNTGRASYKRCDYTNTQQCQDYALQDSGVNILQGIMADYSLNPFMYPPAVNGSFTNTQTSYDGMMLYSIFDGDDQNPLYQLILEASAGNPPYIDNVYGTETTNATDNIDDFNSILYNAFRDNISPFPLYYGAQFFNSFDTESSNIQATVYWNESAKTNCNDGWCQVASGVARLSQAVASFIDPDVKVQNFLRLFPKTLEYSTVNFLSLITSILLGIVFHFLMPSFLRFLVYEKSSRLRVMMQMMGLSTRTYFFVTYCGFLIQYGIMAILVTLIGAATRVDFFIANTPLSYIVLFFLWGNAMISFCYFLAPFFRKSETALVVGWFYVVVVNLVGGPYIGQLYSNDASTSLMNAVSVLPSFAYFRAIYYLGAFNSGGTGVTVSGGTYGQEPVYLGMCEADAPFCTVYIYLIVQWFVLGLIGVYLDRVIPSGDTGVVSHPLFLLGYKPGDPLFKCCYKNKQNPQEQAIEEGAAAASMAREAQQDVQYEIQKAQDPKSKQSGICIQNLVKVFPGIPPKLAVNDLCLAIDEGEVFGMLGHNGAGKTTTINILTGVMEATSGDAYLDGLNLRDDMKLIYANMGVCPQFDIQWADLTANEHLYFYARLKNVSGNQLPQVVKNSLQSVGLENFPDRKSKNFSGGMKRRLSVAMSLIGDPAVVFLDEPTTGLDPKSKHGLWNCIQERKHGKTIVITTHSMEEAERLCDRVCVMASGQLQCVGGPEELKLRLGRGYRVLIQLPEENTDVLHDIVLREISQDAVIESSLAGAVVYSLDRTVLLSKVFESLERHKDELQIIDWGLSQSTLEDVFVDMTQRKHNAVTANEV